MNIFRKSKQQYYSGLITFDGDGRKKEYYTVEDLVMHNKNEVTIEITPNGTIATCTCMAKTFHVDKPVFCSHILTAIQYKIGKIKIRSKEE